MPRAERPDHHDVRVARVGRRARDDRLARLHASAISCRRAIKGSFNGPELEDVLLDFVIEPGYRPPPVCLSARAPRFPVSASCRRASRAGLRGQPADVDGQRGRGRHLDADQARGPALALRVHGRRERHAHVAERLGASRDASRRAPGLVPLRPPPPLPSLSLPPPVSPGAWGETSRLGARADRDSAFDLVVESETGPALREGRIFSLPAEEARQAKWPSLTKKDGGEVREKERVGGGGARRSARAPLVDCCPVAVQQATIVNDAGDQGSGPFGACSASVCRARIERGRASASPRSRVARSGSARAISPIFPRRRAPGTRES